MVNVANYFVKTQPHLAGRWSTTLWEKFQRAKKAVRDAYIKTIGKQTPECSGQLSQVVEVPINVTKQQILRGYRATVGGYAARIQQQMAVRGGAWNGRPGPFSRDFLWRRLRTGHLFGFATLFLVHEENMKEEIDFQKRMDDLSRLCGGLKDAFDKTQETIEEDNGLLPKLSERINDFKLGKCIAVGCNGAVYEAEVNPPPKVSSNSLKKSDSPSIKLNKPLKNRNSSNKSSHKIRKTGSNIKSKKKLAVKMIFNYNSSNSGIIFRQTRSELITCGRGALAGLSKDWQNGSRARMKRLPPHPNIITIYRAMIDKVPDHAEFRTRHPSSLSWPVGFGRTSTMFLIMKRYECTLEDFLKKSPSVQTNLLLALQLLQGVSHLERNNVAHRDLKSNNILIEHDSNDFPRLVIGDFGCSFMPESNKDLVFPFPSSEYDIRNGNPFVQPPEISGCQPGPTSVLDYRRADAWAVGLLLCELFGIERKDIDDVSTMKSCNSKILFIKRLIRMLLMEDPEQRISCTEAANILHLELFGPLFDKYKNEMNAASSPHCNRSGFEVTLTDWLLLHASETFAYRSTTWGRDSIICDIFTNYFSCISLDGIQSAITEWQSLQTY